MKYFSLDELTRSETALCKGIDNTPSAEAVRNLELLTKCVLDLVREEWGSPIIVNSGYRSEELNKAVGGAKSSYHLQGMAADIRPQRGSLSALYDLIVRMYLRGVLGLSECYVDYRKGYIHIAYDNGGFSAWPFLTPIYD